MNFLVVMNAWSPPEDSPARWPCETVRALAQMGHHVDVLAGLVPFDADVPDNTTLQPWLHRHRQGDLTWHDFHQHAARTIRTETQRTTISFVHHIPAQVMHLWGAAGEADHPQGVHDHWPWPINWLVTCRNQLRQRRTPLHELEAAALRDPLVNHIISVSPCMTQHLQTMDGITHDRIRELQPGVETIDAWFTNHDVRKTQGSSLRKQLHLHPTASVMLWPTPGMPRTWFDAAVQALKNLMTHQSSLQVILAGELVYHHHEAITAAGLRDRVRLIPTAGHMHELMPAVDFTLNLTPAPAGVSRHTLMSLAGGLPVITHTFDGSKSFIANDTDNPAGLVIDQPDNPASIAHTLDELLHHHLYQTMQPAAASLAPKLTMHQHADALFQTLR